MRQSDSANAPDIEAQTRQLLARYAEGMPSETSVEARVRSAVTVSPPQQRQRAPQWASWEMMGGWARGAVSLGLVIALVVAFVAVLRLHQGVAHVGASTDATASCPVVQPNSMIKLCPDNHIGASVVVAQTYADPTRTAVMIHINLTNAGLKLGQSATLIQPDGADFVYGATLEDSRGHLYAANEFTSSINYNTTPSIGQAYVGSAGFADFDPLPQAMLGVPQTLTMRFTHILLEYTVRGSAAFLDLSGMWAVKVQITPHPGRSIALHVAPQTFNGITVQPLRLDVGPSGTPFDRVGNGERLTLRISGLPPDTRRSALTNMSFKFFRSDGSGASGDGKPELLFDGHEPASIVGMATPANAPLSLDPIAGPTGVMNLEVIFLGTPLPTPTGVQMLTLNRLCIRLVPTEQTVSGNWSFKIALG